MSEFCTIHVLFFSTLHAFTYILDGVKCIDIPLAFLISQHLTRLLKREGYWCWTVAWELAWKLGNHPGACFEILSLHFLIIWIKPSSTAMGDKDVFCWKLNCTQVLSEIFFDTSQSVFFATLNYKYHPFFHSMTLYDLKNGKSLEPLASSPWSIEERAWDLKSEIQFFKQLLLQIFKNIFSI